MEASLAFMDLVYKHTPMLEQATEASARHPNAAAAATGDEKELRWNQARAEHTRLFEKNRAKGKYCDINPDKVFSEHPELRAALSALSFKPSYRFFLFLELPEAMRANVVSLGITRQKWNLHKPNFPLRKSLWKNLASDEKAAAFALGWNEEIWDRYSKLFS